MSFLIKDMAPEERPREKMIRYGPDMLSNSELTAILLGTGNKTMSAMDLAQKVLAGDGYLKGLAWLNSCIPEELYGIEGIGQAKACRVLAAVELGKRIASMPGNTKICINSPEDVATLMMGKMRHLRKEVFTVINLNVRHEVMSIEEVSVGSVNAALCYPRDVFEKALRKGAAAIMLVHNHPSGNPGASEEDLEVTRRLEEAGLLLGVKVLDHIIIGDGVYLSFMEEGLMKKDSKIES